MSASRARQCRLERLQDAVDRVLDGDRKFFERHVGRSHRLRLAGRAEIEMLQHVHGGQLFAQPGMRIYCVIRQIEPGARMRNFVPNEAGFDTDASEAEITGLFDHLAPPGSQAARAEASMRAALAQRRAAE